jgi:hypothetical protein
MPLPANRAWIAAAAAFLAGAGPALAQNGPVDLSNDLRVVEEGVEDVNPLAVGRVDLSADLAVPLGFGKVYELPPGPDGQRRFARRSGAVWAVFTRADYIRTEDGRQAVAPPNTTIYIGEPPGLRGTEPQVYGPLHTSMRVSTRQDLRANLQPEAQPAQAQAANPPQQQPTLNASILTSEAYRTQRIRTLLSAAAAQ